MRMAASIMRWAGELDLLARVEALTKGVERAMSTTALREVTLTSPESARRARCIAVPLGSRSGAGSGAVAVLSAISTLGYVYNKDRYGA